MAEKELWIDTHAGVDRRPWKDRSDSRRAPASPPPDMPKREPGRMLSPLTQEDLDLPTEKALDALKREAIYVMRKAVRHSEGLFSSSRGSQGQAAFHNRVTAEYLAVIRDMEKALKPPMPSVLTPATPPLGFDPSTRAQELRELDVIEKEAYDPGHQYGSRLSEEG